MNKVFLTGNLTRDPDLRTTQEGKAVCNFTLAVNKRTAADHPEADFFRVTVWGATAENCAKYLSKGRKAGVVGTVHLDHYQMQDGTIRYSLAVNASEVEFLSARQDAGAAPAAHVPPGYTQVDDEELPYLGG